MRSSLPSRPPSQPPPYRQLGSGGQQPVRIQLILGLIVGLVLVAVPLYLWRRPEPSPQPDAAGVDASVSEGGAAFLPLTDASAAKPRVKLSPFTILRCQRRGSGKTPPERCDHVIAFEDALARAIRESHACAPRTKTGAMVSFLFDINFRKKRTTLKSGKSTTISKTQAKELITCVKRAMPPPRWASIEHQHATYLINVKATYPPTETFE